MKIIGLTGSIGMGKSVTAGLFATLGVPVFDSDACVHHLLENRAIPVIVQNFPDIWNTENNAIDRQKLGQIIFADKGQKDKLESILHPMVWQEQELFLAKSRRARKKIVVLDIPLLFETGRDAICDYVVCVSAPPLIQRQRVMRRKNMTEEKFKAILASQLTDTEKQARADFVVPTGLGRGVTLQNLKNILKSIG